MLLRIAAAIGIALAVASVFYAFRSRVANLSKPTVATAARVGTLALGSCAWLVLVSTTLIWLFPLNILASAAVGYFGTKSAANAFLASELKSLSLLSFVCGASIAAAIAMSGDSFMLLVAAPYSLLNAIALAGASRFALRHAHGEA